MNENMLLNLNWNLPLDIQEDAVKEALSSNDEIWIENLSYFLLELKLKENDFTSKNVYFSLLEGSEF